jgi:hypothetical protein
MKWIQDRDALIAQTIAFVQSVSGRKEDGGRFDQGLYRAAAAEPKFEPKFEPKSDPVPVATVPMKTLEISGPPKNIPLSRQFQQVDVKTEIQARIASFRAHQERFNRERHEYFSATLARLRASIEQLPPPR